MGSAVRRVVLAGGAFVVVPLAGLVAARVLALDDRSARVFAVQALTPVLFLPAYVVLVAAAMARLRVLAGVAALVVVSHLAWVVPGTVSGSQPPPERGGRPQPLDVVAVNIAANNDAGDALTETLMQRRADVLVVTELTPALRDVIDTRPFAARYPHRVEDPRQDFFGSAIYSAYPLENQQRFALVGRPAVRTDIVVDGTTVSVVAVHTIQPLADHRTLLRQLDELRAIARTTTGPLLLAGDFNATHHHRGFRRLLDGRLRDAHLDRGRGLARTWPAHGRGLVPSPPLILLDHVLVSDEIAVRAVDEFDIPGSDHRGVHARLRV